MLRQFAVLWILFFLAIAGMEEFQENRRTIAILLAIVAVSIGPIGLAYPRAIRPIYVGWMKLAYPISWVVSHLIFGIVFFVLFTPIALVFRIMGRDVLKVHPPVAGSTYWTPKPAASDSARYLSQF
jgi:RsiW-degrading membrane proteinase PrsW (M82 family)